jgi:hypothetical protein
MNVVSTKQTNQWNSMAGVFVDTFPANAFNCHFDFVYNVLRGIWFLLEGENKVCTANDSFAAFANEVRMFVVVCIVGATFRTKCIYRSAVGYIDRMCNAVLDKGLQCAIDGYPVGRVEEVLHFGKRQVPVLRNHLFQYQHAHGRWFYGVAFEYFDYVGVHRNIICNRTVALPKHSCL